LRHLPDAPRFAGNGDVDIFYLIQYLFLENDAQRARLLPNLADERKEVMKAILDRYKRMAKADIKLGISPRGMSASFPAMKI
jgi:hypothetical protein